MTREVEARQTVGGVIDQVGINHHSRFPVITPLTVYISGLWYIPYWISRFKSYHWVVSNYHHTVAIRCGILLFLRESRQLLFV